MITPEHDRWLHDRAAELGCSVDELLARLIECEQNHRLVLDSLTDIVSRHARSGEFLYVSPAVQTVLGYLPDELAGRSPYDLIHTDDVAEVRQAHRELLAAETVRVEYRVRSRSGEYVWLESTSRVHQPPVGGGRPEIVVVSRPISARKEAEEVRRRTEDALRESESRFRSLLESASGAIIVLGQDGQIVLVNRRAEEMFGYGRDELLGQRIEMLLPERFHHVHREHRHGYVEHPRVRPLGRGLDLVARRKDGQEFAVEIGLSYAPADDGMLVMSYITDITERRQAEESRLEQERLRASLRKEEEFNRLVQRTISALSHDMRTPLTVIATAKDMLEQYYDRLSEQKRREKLGSIGRQLHYVLELLNDMTLVVKGSLDHGTLRPEPVNLVSLCRISMEEIRESTGTQLDLRFVADGQVETVQVDATLVSRILLNLLSNAVKFTPEPGEVRLELSRRDEWIVVRVVDQGIGIAPAEVGHIFEPFYRAANAASTGGTGLGLNIVRECVARHRGQIRVESKLGTGSSFTVELPYAAG